MNLDVIQYRPIGVIRSSHLVMEETPIQPVYARDCLGRAEIFPEFAEGLRDLEAFSHIYLIYHFHRAQFASLLVKPYLQDVERGIFSTRFQSRPNPIGLSVVDLEQIEGNILFLKGVDILDGTPLLDIKPYTAKFDGVAVSSSGWQDEVDEATAARRGRRGYEAGGKA
jgi:tRNA-Thr(GGU) m(6)t(6)A37 methyltransferase TsaA